MRKRVAGVGVLGEVGVQQLDRDGAVERAVVAAPHRAGAALTEPVAQLVAVGEHAAPLACCCHDRLRARRWTGDPPGVVPGERARAARPGAAGRTVTGRAESGAQVPCASGRADGGHRPAAARWRAPPARGS